MMCFTIFFNVFVISILSRLNRNALCSIHFNGRVRGKLTDVCNDASGIRNERPKFLAMLLKSSSYLPRPLGHDCNDFGLTQSSFSSHIVHELMLAHTCAHTCIVAYTALYTIVWRIFLYTIHTLIYSFLAHTSYTCGKQYTCLMMVQTLSLTNIVTCTCIQFN